MISQTMLKEYHQKKCDLKRLQDEVNELRTTLLDSRDHVERGDLTLDVRTVLVRRFTFDSVAAVLGELQAAELRDEIKPTVQTHVIVARGWPDD